MTGGGTERSRPFVTDGYSAPGGVGVALDDLSVRHLGIDIEDYGNTYPGEFVQDDCSDVESTASFETPDLFWLSPKCQAYSILPWANVSRYDWDETPKERYPTFEDPNVREVIGAVAPDHYIIENVVTCDDLRDPCRPNGLAFGLPIENCRHSRRVSPFQTPTNEGRRRSLSDMATFGRNSPSYRSWLRWLSGSPWSAPPVSESPSPHAPSGLSCWPSPSRGL